MAKTKSQGNRATESGQKFEKEFAKWQKEVHGEKVNEAFYFQGYQIDVDPATRVLTVSRNGQVLHTEKTSMVGRPGGAEAIKKRVSIIIDRLEDEKYPDDLEARYSTEKDPINLDRVSAMVPEDASGVIATKAQAKDPRYSMSLTKDVRPGQINKSLRAFNLAETDREPYQQAIDRLENRRIEQLNDLMDEIKQRITREKLPAKYVEELKKRMAKLKAERDSYYRINT